MSSKGKWVARKGYPFLLYTHLCIYTCVCEYIWIIEIYFVSLIYNKKDMKSVREVIKERNELLIKMAFSNNLDEVKKLMNKINVLEYEIRCMTLN